MKMLKERNHESNVNKIENKTVVMEKNDHTDQIEASLVKKIAFMFDVTGDQLKQMTKWNMVSVGKNIEGKIHTCNKAPVVPIPDNFPEVLSGRGFWVQNSGM